MSAHVPVMQLCCSSRRRKKGQMKVSAANPSREGCFLLVEDSSEQSLTCKWASVLQGKDAVGGG